MSICSNECIQKDDRVEIVPVLTVPTVFSQPDRMLATNIF